MQYTLSFAALIAVTTALTYLDLPPCSTDSVYNAITGAGCSIEDIRCTCDKITQIAPSAEPGVIDACPNSNDQDTVVQVMRDVCAAAGTIIDVPGGPALTSATSCLPVVTVSVPSGYIPLPASSLGSSDGYPSPPIATVLCPSMVTITTTRIVSLVTHSPSSLLGLPSTVDTSSNLSAGPVPTDEPYNPNPTSTLEVELPTTSVTGVVELSTFTAPQEPASPTSSLGSAVGSIVSEQSSIAAPQIPYPTALPTETVTPVSSTITSSVYGTGSYSSKLPEFTNAAEAVRVPAVVAGVVGLVAWAL